MGKFTVMMGGLLALGLGACNGYDEIDPTFRTGDNPPVLKPSDDSNTPIDCPGSGRAPMNWVFTEKESGDKTLLLVIQPPERAGELQQVVFRKIYSKQEAQELAADRKRFENSKKSPLEMSPLKTTSTPIWAVTHEWTQADEEDYANWWSDKVTTSSLKGGGVDVDCADAAIALRWIYARDHGLPAADRLAGSGNLMGQWVSTSEWDHLASNSDWKKDEKFKAALRYTLENTFTHSLLGDLYPTEINRTYVSPGSIFLNLYSEHGGHTQTIKWIAPNENQCSDGWDCIKSFWGDEPADETIYSSELTLLNPLAEGKGGFLRFRWPQNISGQGWQLADPAKMPGFSKEQFEWSDYTGNYQALIFSRLKFGHFTPVQDALFKGNMLAGELKYRLHVSELADFYCSVVRCDPSSELYDDYSTPSRDQRIRDAQKEFLAANENVATDPELIQFKKANQEPLISGTVRTFSDYIFSPHLISKLDPDPRKEFSVRWGLPVSNQDDRFMMQFQIWRDNWVNRDNEVSYGVVFCGASASGAGQDCEPDNNLGIAYSTSRLDQAIKKAGQDLLDSSTRVTPAIRDLIFDLAREIPTLANGCAWNPERKCTLYDYLFSGHDLLSKITSAADDPTCKRYGF
jgi:hypothetical protein